MGEATPLSSFPKASTAREHFLERLIGVGTENFENFLPGTGAPLRLKFPGTFQTLTATLRGNGKVRDVAPGSTNGFGRYATSGSQYWDSSDHFSINLDKPVSAFGFNSIDSGDFGGHVTVTTAGGLNQTFDINNTVNGPGGGVLFWGVVDSQDKFTSISFGDTAAGTDVFGFDDMVIGDIQQVRANVPAPALGPASTGPLGPMDFVFPIGGDKAAYLTTEALTGHSSSPGEVDIKGHRPDAGKYGGYYDPYHAGTYSLDFSAREQ